jgi:hypothetical protein
MATAEIADLYDAELTEIDTAAQRLTFLVAGERLAFNTPHPSVWQVGMVGHLTIRSEGSFIFHVYADPRLRRDSSADSVSAGVWGWRLGEYRFTVKAHITPGANGAVVREDLRELRLAIPREFLDLCQEYSLAPATALRDFIADVCALYNFHALPREDGYCSQGSDERQFARLYWERAHEWRREVSMPTQLPPKLRN